MRGLAELKVHGRIEVAGGGAGGGGEGCGAAAAWAAAAVAHPGQDSGAWDGGVLWDGADRVLWRHRIGGRAG